MSPLMIILSSQVLSETIFLFFYIISIFFSKNYFRKNNLFYKIAMAGLFLGFSTTIRSITYPLVFLSVLPFIIILIKKMF